MEPNTEKTPTAKEFEDGFKALADATGEMKTFAETAQAQMAASGKLTDDLRTQVDSTLTKVAGLQGQISDMEQRLARGLKAKGDPALPETAGAIFTASDVFKSYKGGKPNIRVEVPRQSLAMNAMDISAVITSLGASAGSMINPYLMPGVIELPRRRAFIRQLLAQGRTDSNSFKYVREVGFTNAAAVVSETTSKPYSNITFEPKTGNVATIAHLAKASVQVLADVPALRSIIDTRMRFGLMLAEEAQILRGDGAGDNLDGIIPQASAYAAEFAVTDLQRMDVIRLAILQVYLSQFPADGIVLHPTDWAQIELTKDSQGRYLIANPQGSVQPRLWGLPVVDTLAMNQGEFLVGAFQLGAMILDRQDAVVEVATENVDDWEKNLVTIRAEERLALPVTRPEAFVTGDFGEVSGL